MARAETGPVTGMLAQHLVAILVMGSLGGSASPPHRVLQVFYLSCVTISTAISSPGPSPVLSFSFSSHPYPHYI